MFNLGKFILFIIWLLDIFNLPFMQCLDNDLPINTIAWIIIWILVFILNERRYKYNYKERIEGENMDNLKIESVNINDIKPYKNNAKEYKKKYYQEHKDEISRKSKEYRLKNKEKIKQRQHEWYMRNKEQVIERVTEYNKNNNDKRKQWTKNYRIKNIDKINQYKNSNKENLKNYHNKYMKDKMQNDSVFKLKALLRSNIYNAFKRKNMIKDEKAEQILGCNIDEFVQYLLQTFKDNYGYEYNGTEEVHIDHIVPLATAKTKQDIKKLCNYKNLQLLKAHDNLIKWARN